MPRSDLPSLIGILLLIIVVVIRTKGFSFVAEHVDRSRVRAVFDITLVQPKTFSHHIVAVSDCLIDPSISDQLSKFVNISNVGENV